MSPASRRLLVGVGDPRLRRRVCAVITDLGHCVVNATTGPAFAERLGLELLHGTRPAAIIASPCLRGDSRPMLTTTLDALGWPTTPVIYVVSSGDDRGRQLAWASDALGVFVDPFDDSELRAFVELILHPGLGELVPSARTGGYAAEENGR